jgi:DNA modification methylase
MNLIQGDCIDILKTLEDNSIDAIVTDPPYGLSFMGKKWDYDVPSIEVWQECLRVLKPGGYLLSFAGTRTQHKIASGIEDAGFEIRDMIAWIYGSGFPKSLNIGKAVDKLLGNERENLGIDKTKFRKDNENNNTYAKHCGQTGQITKGTSEWEGWGTALKPALEPITVARKPLSEKSVAENVLKWGVGGINIDECRIPTDEDQRRPSAGGENGLTGTSTFKIRERKVEDQIQHTGRFPANLILDGSDEVVELFPNTKSGSIKAGRPNGTSFSIGGELGKRISQYDTHGDSGSAARFFKQCKFTNKELGRIIINCDFCGKPKSIRLSTKRTHNYCSLDCARNGRTKFNSQEVECAYCGKEFIKKNSQMFTDKHFCGRECLGNWQSKFLLGENSYNWDGGVADISSRIRGLKNNIDWRNGVYERDEYTCQICGDNTGGNLHAHHKKLLSEIIREQDIKDIKQAIDCEQLWDLNNGITLCEECHKEEHNKYKTNRFAYIPKASKAERNQGCEELEEKQSVGGGGGIGDYLDDVNSASGKYGSEKAPAKNNHPTVKPISLMEYLIKLVSREGHTILDPFMGSGSTGIACKKLNRHFIGIEREPEYLKIAEARINSIPQTLL